MKKHNMQEINHDWHAHLHAADMESLERRIVELAMQVTGAPNGGLFMWDEAASALAINFHVVAGMTVDLPGAFLKRRTDGRPNGIALWVLDHNRPYLCNDTTADPHYAPYFVDVGSIAAVPIAYQRRTK